MGIYNYFKIKGLIEKIIAEKMVSSSLSHFREDGFDLLIREVDVMKC